MPVGMPLSATAPIPARTERRWRDRFAASARVLVVLLATSGGEKEMQSRSRADERRGLRGRIASWTKPLRGSIASHEGRR